MAHILPGPIMQTGQWQQQQQPQQWAPQQAPYNPAPYAQAPGNGTTQVCQSIQPLLISLTNILASWPTI
jgi:hypothetical protein